jgi:hypothetical protein
MVQLWIMNINLLINTLKDKNKNFKTKFYNKTIKILENINYDKKELPIIFNETDYGSYSPYILEAYKQFLIKNYNNLECYLISNLESSIDSQNDDNIVFIRTIVLTSKAAENLFKQIIVLENNSIDGFMKNPRSYEKFTSFMSGKFMFMIKYKNKPAYSDMLDKYTSYLIPSEIIALFFLGIETFDFLEHQNMEHLLSFINSNVFQHKKSTKHFKDILNLSVTIDFDTRDRTILFSGIILQVLGANYTKDIDIIYYTQNASEYAINNMKDFSTKHENTFDFKMYDNKGDNVENTLEIMVDPLQYFYFLGMKFMSVSQFMQRCYMRSVSGSYVDLIMLNKINNYQIDLCLPNIVSNYGTQIVYDYDKKFTLIDEIIEKLHRWFNIDISINEIQSLIHSCTDPTHDSMIIDQGLDPTTHYIMKYLVFASKEILYKYVTGESVLEIDRFKTRNLLLYPKLNIKHLTILEDSVYMRNHITKNMKKNKNELYDIDVDIVDGTLLNMSDKIIRKQYDTIIVRHDLDIDKDIIDKKIATLSNLSHIGTIIIVIMMNGEEIDKLVVNNDFIINIKSQIKFAIWRLKTQKEAITRDKQKIVLFMERIFEYDKGFVQDVVYIKDTVNKFDNMGFDIIDEIKFSDIDGSSVFTSIKNEMLHTRKKILDLYYVLIFKKR